MSKRTERIGSLIRTLLAEALQRRLSDPRIPPLTSLTRVEVSSDLAIARVYVSVLLPDVAEPERQAARRKLCLAALASAAGHLRRLIGPHLRLRKTPNLVFHLDESVRGSFEIVQAIDRVMAELHARDAVAAVPDAEATTEPAPDQTIREDARS